MKNTESTKSAKEMTILCKYFCHLIGKFKVNSFFFLVPEKNVQCNHISLIVIVRHMQWIFLRILQLL